MSNVDVKNSLRLYLKKLLQYFFQGLIVLAPIGITLWVVVGLFRWIDGFLPKSVGKRCSR
jgi:uncharacterized membrane protein